YTGCRDHRYLHSFPTRRSSDLKLRLSYGETGNERIPAYRYFSEMDNAYYATAGSNIFGMAPSSPANPDLKWETTVQYNAGLDVGDRKSTRLNSSHVKISYAVFC